MENITDIITDALLDACKDTLIIIPFLLITYLAMEWLEHKTSDKTVESVKRAGVAGPAVGALLGAVPQCGFSAAAATLFSGRVVTLGTLIAVFLSTSDEMLPIFIAEAVPLPTILGILGAKVVIGMIAGFIIDLVLRLIGRTTDNLAIDALCDAANCACDEHCAGEPGEHTHAGHDHQAYHQHHEHGAGSIVKSACKHTLQITVFIFLISLALDLLLCFVGEDVLADFIAANEMVSVFASALVGLIPNCAASVAIAQLYVEGALGTGAMLAGLLVSAGIGLLVLCRTNRRPAQNVAIIALLWAIGVVVGLSVNLLGITF